MKAILDNHLSVKILSLDIRTATVDFAGNVMEVAVDRLTTITK